MRYELPAGGGNAPSNPREVQMRKWVSAVIAFVALVVGYSFAPGSAGAPPTMTGVSAYRGLAIGIFFLRESLPQGRKGLCRATP